MGGRQGEGRKGEEGERGGGKGEGWPLKARRVTRGMGRREEQAGRVVKLGRKEVRRGRGDLGNGGVPREQREVKEDLRERHRRPGKGTRLWGEEEEKRKNKRR